ncbi:MAG: polysaccharide pyruvyl transferase family protein [Fibrobacter sp.]|jgi:hypothetical protein|nr:polysaccharide pyruvyl transferase family protein [Fibrobacter sp.]
MEITKKKVGCVIAYGEGHNNYGTSLQSYATLKKIQELGYECEVIRYKKHLSLFRKIWLTIQMFRVGGWHDKRFVIKAKINAKWHKKYAENIAARTQAVNHYKAEKLIPLFKEYNGFENLCKGSLNYATVLVGSDQLLTPLSLYGKYYNLLFVDDRVPKVAYAVSFGVSKIPLIQEKQTGEYLNRFDFIGVREAQGKKIVETLSHNKATVVCDPTLLLTREEWAKEIENSAAKITEPYIFCYFLGTNSNARKAANELRQKTGLKIITIRHMDEYVADDEQFGDEAPYDVSPNDFVKYISEAQYICTDSFHCSVFAVLFQRQFMTFYRYSEQNKESRNSRIDSLLGLLGLGNRIFKTHIFDSMQRPISYAEVEHKIKLLREESLQFLKNALEFKRIEK